MEQAREREQQHQEEFLREFRQFDLSPIGRLLFEVIRNQFATINRLDVVIEQNEKIMASQADLDAALQGEGTDLQTATAALTALEQKLSSITPGQPAPDLSAEVAQVAQFRAALQSMASSLTTDASNLGTSGSGSTGTSGSGTDSGSPSASAQSTKPRQVV